MIKIALAEDNRTLAKNLEDRLNSFQETKLKIIAPNGSVLLKQLEKDSNLDVVLMDIQMPVMDGITAVANVKQMFAHIKVIMLTVMDDENSIFNAIKAGADGYLLKDVSSENLLKGIQDIMNGGAPMSPTIALKTLRLLRNPIASQDSELEDFSLSKREVEVLEQLSRGLHYKEIANNLNISVGTVRKHLENTYRKLQVHNKVEAVTKARSARIIE